MKKLVKIGLDGQSGFTIIELMISIAITAVIGVGIGSVILQTVQQNSRAVRNLEAVQTLENAIFRINEDVMMSQVVTPADGSGFPLELRWQSWDGNRHYIQYLVTGGNIERRQYLNDVLSSQTPVAKNISMDADLTNCSFTGVNLELKLTSAVGTTTETRIYQIKPRVDRPPG